MPRKYFFCLFLYKVSRFSHLYIFFLFFFSRIYQTKNLNRSHWNTHKIPDLSDMMLKSIFSYLHLNFLLLHLYDYWLDSYAGWHYIDLWHGWTKFQLNFIFIWVPTWNLKRKINHTRYSWLLTVNTCKYFFIRVYVKKKS